MANKTDPKNAEKELTLEQAVERLDAIVEELESGEADLEKSIALYEEGRKLGAAALTKLEAFEKRIEIITGEGEDGLVVEDFGSEET